MNRKTIIFLAVLGVLCVSISYIRVRGDEVSLVSWSSEYEAGLARARAENKVAAVDFYADWCSWCKTLDRETYNNPDVASYLNARLVCIRVDMDKNTLLSQNYGITGLPTVLFLSGDGREVGRIVGYEPPGQFMAHMQSILSR